MKIVEIDLTGGALGGQTFVSFLGDGEFDSFTLGQGDVRLGTLADNEHVVQPGGKHMTVRILHVHNVKGTRVSLSVHYGAHTPQVAASGNHAQVTSVKTNVINNLGCGNFKLDGVINSDLRVWVSDGSAIVRHQEWDSFGPSLNSAYFTEFVFGFLICDSVDCETSFNIIDQSEEFTGLLDGNNIHESSRVVCVSSDFAINLDETLHQNLHYLLVGKGILQTIPQKDDQRQGFSQLVGSSAGTGSKYSTKFVQHP